MLLRLSTIGLLCCFLWTCDNKKTTNNASKMIDIDIQGHRGCRGLMPENTLPAFQKALELGVNTLEMDLVISSDDQVLVSHEPYFREGIGLKPDGSAISKEEEKSLNIYEMTYNEARTYILGTVSDPKHPDREDVKTYKPRFDQVVRQAQDYAYTNEVEVPFFNIEVKRTPDGDNVYHPSVGKYVNLVLNEIKRLGIQDKVILQSFDLEALRIAKTNMPGLPLALLIQNMESVADNIQQLGFKPDIYSNYFKLLNQEDVDYLQERDIKVIPWTVNSNEDILSMIDLGVDGIISDYPDRVIALTR